MQELIYVFISLPMNGFSDEEILQRREEISKAVIAYYDKKNISVKILNQWYSPNCAMYLRALDTAYPSVNCLGNSIADMASANVVCFANGWEDTRGCRIEHEVAKEYEMEIIYEKDLIKE